MRGPFATDLSGQELQPDDTSSRARKLAREALRVAQRGLADRVIAELPTEADYERTGLIIGAILFALGGLAFLAMMWTDPNW